MLLDYDFLRKHTIVYQLNKDAISDVSSVVLIKLTTALLLNLLLWFRFSFLDEAYLDGGAILGSTPQGLCSCHLFS